LSKELKVFSERFQSRQVKLWEDERLVLEEGLATVQRVQNLYRQRLQQVPILRISGRNFLANNLL
jgi:hypothetical protein